MRPALDYRGKRFGMLVATEPTRRTLSSGRRMTAWVLKCDCGEEVTAFTENLRKGKHMSCGCDKFRAIGEANATHGAQRVSSSREDRQLYSVWRQMKDRCFLKTAPNYHWYGGNGVTVCDRWVNGDGIASGFECFRQDMGPRPKGMTLDRVDPTGNYEPGNCRWASWQVQNTNKRASASS